MGFRRRVSSAFSALSGKVENKDDVTLVNIRAVGSDASSDDAAAAVAAIDAAPAKVELTEAEGRRLGILADSFSPVKKWCILASIVIVQISMNWNASIYANAVAGLMERFAISSWTAHLGQAVFLIAYAFGCEAWAPWSEELGRYWVLQISLGLVNLWQIPCALAPTFATILAARTLGGLSSAGGSVTLGLVADLYGPADHQYALAYVVNASCAGSVLAPIFGGFMTEYLPWQWVFWISLILGVVAQAVHFFVPETRGSVLCDRYAQAHRKSGANPYLYGPNEINGTFWERISLAKVVTLMWRPYKFLLTEPIVGSLSALSGFSDALVFAGLDSFALILTKWAFSGIGKGLAFSALLLGYMIATLSFLLRYKYDRRAMGGNPNAISPERRLWLLLWLVPLMPIGLFGLAWTSRGPPEVHWMAPMVFVVLIGIANLAIYQATIDYMVAAYGDYSASATGGNGFCRDFLAGIAALYASPFYKEIAPGTSWQTVSPTLMLSFIAVLLCIPVYIFYWQGPTIRRQSKYAEKIASEREKERAEQETGVAPGPLVVRSPEAGGHGMVVEIGPRGGEFSMIDANAVTSS